MPDKPSPLIVTLELDSVSFERMNALRQMHFPPERNFLSAHITLFHALPGEERTAVRSHLQHISARAAPMHLAFPRLRMLGRGVAIEVESEALQRLHGQLAACFGAWLTPQDRQRFRPHVTIQNKVTPQQARELHDALAPVWEMPPGQGTSLLLWEYRGGPWLGVEAFSLTGEGTAPSSSLAEEDHS